MAVPILLLVALKRCDLLAITDFLAKKTQLVNYCENPLPGTPPFAFPNKNWPRGYTFPSSHSESAKWQVSGRGDGQHAPAAGAHPKDPPVLKIVRRANSLRREKNATAIAKRYGECSEVLF